MTTTREEHLAWCKERALEYADRGDLVNAVASMASDVQKHDETKMPDTTLATLVLAASFDAAAGNGRRVIDWIGGFR